MLCAFVSAIRTFGITQISRSLESVIKDVIACLCHFKYFEHAYDLSVLVYIFFLDFSENFFLYFL